LGNVVRSVLTLEDRGQAMHWEPISERDRKIIARQLRRNPRNMCGIARRCPCQCPQVIVNHPLPQEEGDAFFFPTVFWLTCPEAIRQISRMEDQGFIRQIQARLSDHKQVSQSLEDAHLEYIFIRRKLLGKERLLQLRQESRPLSRHLERLGIGGLSDLSNIKCLHMHYAHFLATRSNPVGSLIEKTLEFSGEWKCQGCHASDPAGVAE